jgi:hypothetical protein
MIWARRWLSACGSRTRAGEGVESRTSSGGANLAGVQPEAAKFRCVHLRRRGTGLERARPETVHGSKDGVRAANQGAACSGWRRFEVARREPASQAG